MTNRIPRPDSRPTMTSFAEKAGTVDSTGMRGEASGPITLSDFSQGFAKMALLAVHFELAAELNIPAGDHPAIDSASRDPANAQKLAELCMRRRHAMTTQIVEAVQGLQLFCKMTGAPSTGHVASIATSMSIRGDDGGALQAHAFIAVGDRHTASFEQFCRTVAIEQGQPSAGEPPVPPSVN